MIVLNLKEVLWLAGTSEQVEKFLTQPDLFLLGRQDDVRGMLIQSTTWLNMADLEPIIKQGKDGSKPVVPASFVLVQGKIVGLVTTPKP